MTVNINYLCFFVSGCIPCQEEGNVSFVLENGVGAYSEDPLRIAHIIARWFDTESKELKEMSAKAKLLGRPEATFNIVCELAGEEICMNARKTTI